ncbi:MAG: SMC-Scp complex subunit ScpB [Steroidobacteraceae bacterium]
MSEQYNRNVIEAGLLAAGKSLTLAELAQLFDENARPAATEVRAALEQLAADYAGRALELRETASGFRVQVRREFANEVSRLWPERPQRYSRALLETLALIAYRQPITRAEIESVRGVAVNPNIIKTLLERNWIRVVGHRDLPGRPELLGTTREFLDYFGLRNLEELPTLAELRSLNDIDPQIPLPVPGEAAAEPADGVAARPGRRAGRRGGARDRRCPRRAGRGRGRRRRRRAARAATRRCRPLPAWSPRRRATTPDPPAGGSLHARARPEPERLQKVLARLGRARAARSRPGSRPGGSWSMAASRASAIASRPATSCSSTAAPCGSRLRACRVPARRCSSATARPGSRCSAAAPRMPPRAWPRDCRATPAAAT